MGVGETILNTCLCDYVSECAINKYDSEFFNKEGNCIDGGKNCPMKKIKDYSK